MHCGPQQTQWVCDYRVNFSGSHIIWIDALSRWLTLPADPGKVSPAGKPSGGSELPSPSGVEKTPATLTANPQMSVTEYNRCLFLAHRESSLQCEQGWGRDSLLHTVIQGPRPKEVLPFLTCGFKVTMEGRRACTQGQARGIVGQTWEWRTSFLPKSIPEPRDVARPRRKRDWGIQSQARRCGLLEPAVGPSAF